jgi:hypothetical protein
MFSLCVVCCVGLGLAELPCLSSNYRSPFHCRYIFFMPSKIIFQPSLFYLIKSPLSLHSIGSRSRFTLARFIFLPMQFLYDVSRLSNTSFLPMSPYQHKQSNPLQPILVSCYLDVMPCKPISVEIVSPVSNRHNHQCQHDYQSTGRNA